MIIKQENCKLLKLLKDWKDIKRVCQYKSLLYISKIICFKLINCYYNDLLAGYFKIDKTQKLISKKYNWHKFY